MWFAASEELSQWAIIQYAWNMANVLSLSFCLARSLTLALLSSLCLSHSYLLFFKPIFRIVDFYIYWLWTTQLQSHSYTRSHSRTQILSVIDNEKYSIVIVNDKRYNVFSSRKSFIWFIPISEYVWFFWLKINVFGVCDARFLNEYTSIRWPFYRQMHALLSMHSSWIVRCVVSYAVQHGVESSYRSIAFFFAVLIRFGAFTCSTDRLPASIKMLHSR